MLLMQIVVFQIIVFGAVIFFLKKILYQDTESSINRLDRVYQEMLNKQKELTQKIEAAEKEYGAKKEEATLIVSKMKAEAMDEVRQKQDEVIKKAKSEAEEIMKKAHESEEKFQKGLEKNFNVKVINQSVKLLGVVFSPKLAGALHRELVIEFLERSKAFDLSGVGAHIDTLTVKSAMALQKDEQDKIQAFIGSKLNRSIKIKYLVEANLVAGVLFQFGTLLLDGSFTYYVREAAEQDRKTLAMKD